MAEFLNNFKRKGLALAEYVIPVLKESKFRETGVLTPEEFVYAGDHLVHHCPTWKWASGDPSKLRPYLPKDKQFLVTKNVPCYKRCSEIECYTNEERIIESDDEDGGWVDTHHSIGPIEEESSVFQATAVVAGYVSKSKSTVEDKVDNDEDDDDDTEIGDMEQYMALNLADREDKCVVEVKKPEARNDSISGGEIIPTRTYDLNITYDKYYQTPRLWLCGYDENHKPLTIDEMYNDISQDHAKKTVTMEIHPHIPGGPMAAVHPCRHAEVMKKIIQTVEEGGKKLDVHLYLIIFLKFVQAVIPTIEYDYTQNFTM